MKTPWQRIADCLRNELAEYGAFLRLFEAQQRSLFERDAEAVLRFAQEIETQAKTLGATRGAREVMVARFAVENDFPPNSTLRAMLPRIEPDARPLLEALINEVNLLLHRVRRTSRHNHALLARTIDLHRETLLQLRPGAFTQTYSPAGRVAVAAPRGAGTLHCAG